MSFGFCPEILIFEVGWVCFALKVKYIHIYILSGVRKILQPHPILSVIAVKISSPFSLLANFFSPVETVRMGWAWKIFPFFKVSHCVSIVHYSKSIFLRNDCQRDEELSISISCQRKCAVVCMFLLIFSDVTFWLTLVPNSF